MQLTRRTGYRIAIMAMLVHVFSLLAPIASSAWMPKAGSPDDPWSAVCSSARPGAASDSSGGGHGDDGMRCPCCLSGLGQLALPPTPVAVALPQTTPFTVWPALFLDGPHTLHAWMQRQGRAPPRSA
jgi:hypothetical protein